MEFVGWVNAWEVGKLALPGGVNEQGQLMCHKQRDTCHLYYKREWYIDYYRVISYGTFILLNSGNK